MMTQEKSKIAYEFEDIESKIYDLKSIFDKNWKQIWWSFNKNHDMCILEIYGICLYEDGIIHIKAKYNPGLEMFWTPGVITIVDFDNPNYMIRGDVCHTAPICNTYDQIVACPSIANYFSRIKEFFHNWNESIKRNVKRRDPEVDYSSQWLDRIVELYPSIFE